jgi:hypothetical protein
MATRASTALCFPGRRLPADSVGFGYHKPVPPILIVFVVVSALDCW